MGSLLQPEQTRLPDTKLHIDIVDLIMNSQGYTYALMMIEVYPLDGGSAN